MKIKTEKERKREAENAERIKSPLSMKLDGNYGGCGGGVGN